MTDKTIEQTYQKKTPLEHILLRPDTYVGSIQMEKSYKWILPLGDFKFSYEEISYVPALYKIFDEVLVNAADNYQRDRKMNLLRVDINPEEGWVSVLNNGKGIPVIIHKQEKIYVPELIFGHLLTGSNYNDDQKKVVGGRNGYGAKLANIFSTKFIVQCGDAINKKKFKMTWQKNMTMHGEAEISCYSGKDYTCVTFYPEFKRFSMQAFDRDIIALCHKRVYDMAGLLPSVKVFLNSSEIPINSFLKYVNMYFSNDQTPKLRDETVDTDRWQVIVSISDGQFRQVSFVNGICTSKGGTHVNYITDQIVQRIQERLAKKDKKLNIKPFQIKGHLWIFVNALVQNPAFDSQTKETLTLKQSMFGSACVLSQKMIKDILKTGIIDEIYNEAKAKQLSKLARVTGGQKKAKLTGIPKLEDANEAGTKNSQKCTLILTEGDSAKSLAMAGLQVIGRDYYGVFPLKGKLLNVREAANSVLMKNEQIQNLMKIMGLQIGRVYDDLKSLRYGSIMIMSDQDTDGSHIKGLVINFIHNFWPSLFRTNGFLKQFITPLLKVTKGKECVSFYTMTDFKNWAEYIQNLKTWKIKYYKGLGTSTDKEAQQYFSQLERSRIYFAYFGKEDDDSMELIFSKKNIQKRKQWLSNYDPNLVMVYDRTTIGYKQFVDRQFIHFSNEDNIRSIASIIDGFKPGQRKIIFSCFKRNLKDEIKVAQLAGYVAEHSAYHHGEMSLTMTIVNMAQNFVGANNINLLMPNGQFGSRNLGGKDHASARYIFTNLSRVTRYIYLQADDHTLTYIEDDGQFVEPEFYIPILPMGLVNGCEGIGSGWSTFVPNYNPREICQMLIKKLESNKEFEELNPWYKGFIGQITKKQDGNFEVKGLIEFDPERKGVIHIKQLPINKWTKDYKIYLDDIMKEGDTKIQSLKEYHTKNKVHFEIQLNPNFYNEMNNDKSAYDKLFKLTSNISMKNIVGFNKDKKLHRYQGSKEIMEDFYQIRILYYQKRKDYLMSKLVREVQILKNKARFIVQVVEEKLVIRNLRKLKLVEVLNTAGYTKFSDFPNIKSTKMVKEKKEDQEGNEKEQDTNDSSKEYNYLLSMPLWNLTYEKVEQLKSMQIEKQKQLISLERTEIKSIWLHDLKEFLNILNKVENDEEEQTNKADEKTKGNDKGKKARKKAVKNEKQKIKGQKSGKKERQSINWDDSQVEEEKTGDKRKTKNITNTADGEKLTEADVNETTAKGNKANDANHKGKSNTSVLIAAKPSKKGNLYNRVLNSENEQFQIVTAQKIGNKMIKNDSDEE